MVEERAYYVAWSQIERVGPVLIRRLQQHFGTLADAWKASATQLQAVEGFGYQLAGAVTAARSQINLEQLLEQHSAKNPYFWTIVDADYPRLLLEIPSPPPVLYYRGIVQPKENQGITPLVGIVGTREPSEYGKRWTRKISTALAPLHRLLQIFWGIGGIAATVLALSSSEPLALFVYNHPTSIFGIGFTFAALTGIYFKEAFCFNRLETKFLTPLVPMLLLGHIAGVLPTVGEQVLLGLWAFLFLVFALRKVVQSIPQDIGDKSVFAYLKEKRAAHS